MSTQLSNHELRKQLRKQRSSLAQTEQQQLSKQAIQHLIRQRIFRSARNIALYLPVRGEADPRSLLKFAHPKQRFFLPVLSLSHNSHLTFVEWNLQTRFRSNRFNIPEPLLAGRRILSPRQLDLVITPLVAFDQQGSRLGMGGGFYDRSFAFKRYPKHSKPVLLGFAYPFQQIERLKCQDWDIGLDASCTASGLIFYTDLKN
ncbi:MAG: 5-formyltetrahydrofolate cyclo-ligase [Thiolinea sp.]